MNVASHTLCEWSVYCVVLFDVGSLTLTLYTVGAVRSLCLVHFHAVRITHEDAVDGDWAQFMTVALGRIETAHNRRIDLIKYVLLFYVSVATWFSLS